MDKDIERAPEVPQGSRTGACTFARARLGAWILVNLLATTSIVSVPAAALRPPWKHLTVDACSTTTAEFCNQIYVNKSIFGNVFGKCPSSFVAFHFAITGATLLLLSRPALGVFQSVRIDTLVMLPLVVVMGANVLLMNLALAWSSIVFYQIVRVLLSPITAAINFFLYRSRIPLAAFFALLVACAGVGVVSHFDKKGSTAVSGKQTSTMGAIFAVIGVCCSAIYTVWVSQYHKKLSLSSPQLLLNMVPLGTLLLAMASFFTDEFPVWRDVTARQWGPVVLVSFSCLSLGFVHDAMN